MRTLLDLVGWNVTRPLIVFEKEPGFSGGGGSPSPSSVAQSAVQGIQSVTQDPAVAKTGENLGTQKRGSSPRPPKRPSALDKKVYDATGNIAKDLHMGFSTLFQSKEKQAETLAAKGYSDEEIKSYQDRTAASQERMRQSMMNSSSDDDKVDSSSKYQAVVDQIESQPPGMGAAPQLTAPPAPSADAEPEAGSAEEEVVEGAKKRKGRASTIATAPSGLLSTAKTRRRRSLIGGGEPGGLIS